MTRPRKKLNLGLPHNLYRKEDKRLDKVYFAYRDPRTGTMHGLGSNREDAINDAKALNSTIYESIKSARLLAITNPVPQSEKLITATKKHMELCEFTRNFAENTLRTRKSSIKALEHLLGAETPIGSITVRDIVKALEVYNDRPRMKQTLRSAAVEIWKDAIEEGWVSDIVDPSFHTVN